MNDFHPFKRRGGRLAFALSCLLHVAVGALIFFAVQKLFIDHPSMGPREVTMLDIRQEKLQAAAESVPQQSAPLPPKPVEVPLEEIQKPPEPQPEPAVTKPAEASESQVSSEAQTAQVSQPASAPGSQMEAAETLSGQGRTGEVNWQSLAVAKLRKMVESEKYYPPSAQKAGYTGRFRVRIRLEPDGTVSGYEIKERRGHPLLGKAVEATLEKIKGRNVGLTLPERFEVLMPIEFELK